MDYTAMLATMRTAANSLHLATRRLGWSVARTIPSAIQRTVTAQMEVLNQSEVFRRLPGTEHARVFGEKEREETTARRFDTGAALFKVAPHVQPLQRQLTAYVEAMRRDTSLSFDGALDRVTADGMIMLSVLELQMLPIIESASAADLLRRYQTALESKSGRGLTEARLIEDRVARGGLSKVESDIPIVKELAELVNDVQDLRVEPHAELQHVAEVIADASKAVSRADLAQVRALDPERHAEAKAAHEATEEDYAEAVAQAEAAARAARQ